MREIINRGCAWVMVVVSMTGLGMLLLGIAARPKIPVVAFWALVLFFGVYVLFFKKHKEKASK